MFWGPSDVQLTLELTGRAHNAATTQVSRMRAALFALRSNDLLAVVSLRTFCHQCLLSTNVANIIINNAVPP